MKPVRWSLVPPAPVVAASVAALAAAAATGVALAAVAAVVAATVVALAAVVVVDTAVAPAAVAAVAAATAVAVRAAAATKQRLCVLASGQHQKNQGPSGPFFYTFISRAAANMQHIRYIGVCQLRRCRGGGECGVHSPGELRYLGHVVIVQRIRSE